MARRGNGDGAAVADRDEAEARLLGVPVESFVAVRGELARALRAQGDAAGAREIARLRKPSLALWAVNQLARRFGAEVDQLLKAGDTLRAAQAEAGDPEAFRAAVAEERRLVASLAERAAAVLESAGHAASDTNVERVRRTLRAAAAASDEERERLRRGTLLAEIEPAGFAQAFAALGLPEQGAPKGASSMPRAVKPAAPKPPERTPPPKKRATRAEAPASEAEPKPRPASAIAAKAHAARERLERRHRAIERAEAEEREAQRLRTEAARLAQALAVQQRHGDNAEAALRRGRDALAKAEQAATAARARVEEAERARDEAAEAATPLQARVDELHERIAAHEAAAAAALEEAEA